MNNTSKLLATGAFFLASLAYTNAQTNGTSFFVTNLVMDLKIKGIIYEQSGDGQVTQRRIVNKDAINLIGQAQGITVGSRSKLVVAVPIGASEEIELPRPEVRLANGSEVVTIGDHMNLFETATIEGGTSVTDIRGRKETDHGIWQLSFDAGDAAFEGYGFATFSRTLGSSKANGKGKLDFAGNGTSRGNPAVVKGTATTSGKTTETVEIIDEGSGE